MRVLLIEDHKPLVRALKQGLEEEGFAVDVASDGREGDFKARTAEYDVIVLDLMLPKEDGLSLLQRWRKEGLSTHVLVLTARGSVEDKVKGLDLGADDYMTKPFELEELLARLRPHPPRSSGQKPSHPRPRPGDRHGQPYRQARRQIRPPDASRVRPA
jgi:DNA-binding response OmpR family regulator